MQDKQLTTLTYKEITDPGREIDRCVHYMLQMHEESPVYNVSEWDFDYAHSRKTVLDYVLSNNCHVFLIYDKQKQKPVGDDDLLYSIGGMGFRTMYMDFTPVKIAHPLMQYIHKEHRNLRNFNFMNYVYETLSKKQGCQWSLSGTTTGHKTLKYRDYYLRRGYVDCETFMKKDLREWHEKWR